MGLTWGSGGSFFSIYSSSMTVSAVMSVLLSTCSCRLARTISPRHSQSSSGAAASESSSSRTSAVRPSLSTLAGTVKGVSATLRFSNFVTNLTWNSLSEAFSDLDFSAMAAKCVMVSARKGV